MSDVLPLLLLPAVMGWWFTETRKRKTRSLLREAIAAGPRPLLADAGLAPVTAVARSLEILPGLGGRAAPWWLLGRRRSAWDVQELVAPLGLQLDEVIAVSRDRLRRPVGFNGASRFSGARYGRSVAVELGVAHSAIVLTGPAPMPRFTVAAGADGRLVAEGAVPAAVEAALDTLAPSRHWRGLLVSVDAGTARLARGDVPASSWLHDLWITEFVADLASPAVAAAPASGPVHGDEAVRATVVAPLEA
ncbi:MAG: hypothetical protein J7513_17665 [Solirubrobacteraceae bacterium]|nr:hypothetical protein [Solirubrobacteraceae bacterium]